MSRVLTFSRTFPSYHPKKGEPTYFVEKILNSFEKRNYFCCSCDKCCFTAMSSVWEGGGQIADTGDYDDMFCPKCYSTDYSDIELTEDYYIGKYVPKGHTIRAGHRWKVGDKFSPRVWSGKPYQSKQIIIAPDIEVKKVWNFEIKEREILVNGKILGSSINLEISLNDGLLYSDFLSWFRFPSPFDGQIICWDENINY